MAMTCPKCGGEMVVKAGKRGDFLSCLRYPDCKGTAQIADEPVTEAKVVPPVPEELPLADMMRIVLGELRSRRSVLDDFRRLKIEDLPTSVDYVGRQLERIGDILQDVLLVLNAAVMQQEDLICGVAKGGE